MTIELINKMITFIRSRPYNEVESLMAEIKLAVDEINKQQVDTQTINKEEEDK